MTRRNRIDKSCTFREKRVRCYVKFSTSCTCDTRCNGTSLKNEKQYHVLQGDENYVSLPDTETLFFFLFWILCSLIKIS